MMSRQLTYLTSPPFWRLVVGLGRDLGGGLPAVSAVVFKGIFDASPILFFKFFFVILEEVESVPFSAGLVQEVQRLTSEIRPTAIAKEEVLPQNN